MEIIIFLLFVWFLSRIFRKRTRKVADKWEAFEVAAAKQQKQQQKYDEYMMSLPELVGDESYSREDKINVIVEAITTKQGEKQVRVEAGQAVIGFIPREEVAQFHAELAQFGGIARASARFYWSPDDGKSSITLDVVRPLRQA